MHNIACLSAGWAAAIVAGPLAVLATSVAAAAPSSIPIQHVVIIMQENRSFDNYFGAYPYTGIDGNKADGIPSLTTCLPTA
jgi:phospholipase C